jgi:hypothetical protein
MMVYKEKNVEQPKPRNDIACKCAGNDLYVPEMNWILERAPLNHQNKRKRFPLLLPTEN